MPTVANSLFDRNAAVIKEEIGNSAMEFMAQEDPIFREMILGDMDMVSPNELGRDLKFKKRFYGALTGVIRGGHVTQDASANSIGGKYAALYGEGTTALGPKMYTQTVARTFPNALHGANPRPYGLTGGLYNVETNLFLTMSMLNLDATPANIMEHVVPTFKGFAKHIARWAANSFHADPDNGYSLASLGLSTGGNAYSRDSSARTIKFFPTEEVAHRFEVGMALDIYSDTSGTRVNELSSVRILCFVAAVDYWANEVTLVTAATDVDGNAITFNTTFSVVNIGESAYVTFAEYYDTNDSEYKGLYTWRHWMKFGGSTNAQKRLLGDDAETGTADDYIDVEVHPQFKSGLFANVGSLTERTMLAHLDRAFSALGVWGYELDTLIASEGVWLNMFDSKQGFERQLRDGPGNVNDFGLQEGFTIVHNGKTVRGVTSRWLEDGLIMGTRRSGNWNLLVPPSPGEAQGQLPDPEGDLSSKIPLEFIVPFLTGSGSTRFPILTSNGELTQGTQMPGWIRMQMVPGDQIPGCVWSDVNTTRVYTNTGSV